MPPFNISTRETDGSLYFELVEVVVTLEEKNPALVTKAKAIIEAMKKSVWTNESTEIDSEGVASVTFCTENMLVPSDVIDVNSMNNEDVAEQVRNKIAEMVRAIEPRSKVTAKFMETKPREWDFIKGDDEFDDDFSEDGLV